MQLLCSHQIKSKDSVLPLIAREAKWLVAATFLAFLLVKYMYKSTEPLNKMMMTQRLTTTLTTVESGAVDAVTIASGSVQRSIISR